MPLDSILSSVPLEKFFTVDYWKKNIIKKFPRNVLLIDEAQKYFPKGFKNNDVLFFFQYHRHLGLDIYLITQDAKLISSRIYSLIEYEIRAFPRSFQPGRFVYSKRVMGENVGRLSLPKDNKVFSLYSSAMLSESEKPPNFVRNYAFIFVACLLVVIFSFYFFLQSFKRPEELSSNDQPKQVQKLSEAAPPSKKVAGRPKVHRDKKNEKRPLRAFSLVTPAYADDFEHFIPASKATDRCWYVDDGTFVCVGSDRFFFWQKRGWVRWQRGRLYFSCSVVADPARYGCPGARRERGAPSGVTTGSHKRVTTSPGVINRPSGAPVLSLRGKI